MTAFESSATVAINTAEATQKLKEILNLDQAQVTFATENTMNFVNGNSEQNASSSVYSDGSRMLDSIVKTSLVKQNITLQGNDDFNSFDVYGQNVTITASQPNQISGNSRVRIKNIVDYGWEPKYYYGRLIAVHISGNYLAYGGIIAREKNTGIVRVVNRNTGDRILLKGMTGFVKDLAFAHIVNEVILAIVDEVGNLFVYNIKEDEGKMISKLALHIKQDDSNKASDFHRVIWCQYIPDEGIEDDEPATMEDAAKLLVITNDHKAEMLNTDIIIKKYGEGLLSANDLSMGYQIISDHVKPIVDAAFSPDGAALATASLDGEVKFFQVYMHSESAPPSRCLHQWKPHDGKPLSCIFFLDNHKNRNPEVQFWKFAITGAENNQEIKIWCCESWNCLQSINFVVAPGDTLQPCIKAGLDLSANYLILSDINRKVLYVLMLFQDMEQKVANVSSISEFPLPFPMLSYAITDASCKKYKQSVDTEHIEEFNSEDNENTEDDVHDDSKLIEGVVVRLFFIQPKSLQECRIAFQPRSSAPFPACSVSSLSQESVTTGFRDRLSDMSFDASVGNDADLMNSDDTTIRRNSLSQTVTSSRQILLTPDAFTSPNHGGVKPLLSSVFSNSTPTSVPLPPVTPSEEAMLATAPSQEKTSLAASETLETEQRQSGRSSGSSPSLEVQQILAPRKTSLVEKEDKKGREVHSRNSEDNSMIFSPTLTAQVNILPENIHHSEELISLSSLPASMPPANILPKEYDPTIWPLPPNLNNELKVITNGSLKDRSGQQSFDNSQLKPPSYPVFDNSRLDKLERRLEEAVEVVLANQHAVTEAVQVLKTELREMHDEHKKQPGISLIVQNMGQLFEKLENATTSLMEKKLTQMKQADNKQLEGLLMNLENKERQRHERMLGVLSQSLTTTISNRLDSILKSEIRNVIPPTLETVFEPMKQQFQLEISQKFSDSALKESIGKILKNKSTVEAIGGATANALHGYIQSSYKDSFQNIVIPAFEKACQNLFHQLNENFQKGFKEYSQLLETHLERKRRQGEQTKDTFMAQAQNLLEAFQASSEQVTSSVASNLQEEMEKQLQSSLVSMQEILVKRIQHSVKEEINNAMKEQQSLIGDSVMHAIRSGAVTPIPAPDPQMLQARIAQLVRQGQINAAFQQALSASDLSLVMFLCESLPPTKVFGKLPCMLEQPVLLSLIQQLSADLTNQTELKLKYLQEAIISLDQNNPKEHVDVAIGLLQKKLQLFMKNNPNSEFSRMMKMLLMTSQSLLLNSV